MTTTPKLKGRILQSLSRRLLNLSVEIESFKARAEVHATAGSLVASIQTYTKQRELTTLYRLAADCPEGAVAIEIGSHLGASTCYIASGVHRVKGHLFCVDTWQNETMPEGSKDTFAEFGVNTQQIRHLITVIRKRSEELVASELQIPLSLAFIDGDHEYSSVKKDFEKVSQWIYRKGTIAFHDNTTIFPGVPRVIGEALATGSWALGGYVDSLCWIVRTE